MSQDMEELYQKQRTRFDDLQTNKTNYKKDGEVRKTQIYVQKRLVHIDKIWQEFIDTDTIMKDEYFDENQTHNYWIERDSVKQFYTNYRTELDNKLKTLGAVSGSNEYLTAKPTVKAPEPLQQLQNQGNIASDSNTQNNNREASNSDGTSNESTHSNVDNSAELPKSQARKYKVQDVKMRLCYRLMETAEQLLNAESNNEALQHKLNQLDARLAQIEQLHEELLIDMTPEEETLPYFRDDYYQTLVNNFESIRIKITRVLKKPSTNKLENQEVKLKRIEIPHFHGDPLKWASFHDLFRRLIHENSQMSETVKMHQLKTTVFGSAGRLISHLEATGDNYNDAWKLLVNRYQNKRQLASIHVNAILSSPVIQSESAASIKCLHDLLTESLHAIKNLGIITVSWNYIIIPIVTKKLDAETSRLFEMFIPDPREMPTLEDFLNFLERRFQALEAAKPKTIVRSSGATPQVARVNTYHTQTERICVLCKQGHDLKDCMKFKQMSTLERSKFVASNHLCNMCFKRHQQPCPQNIRCLVCKGAHNTLLHTNNQPQRTMLTTEINDTPKIKAAEKCRVTNHLVNEYDELKGTLLATAMVQVQSDNQQSRLLRMLIDPGSQISFITEEACKQIKKQTEKTHMEIGGINESQITTATKLATFCVEPRFSSIFSMEMRALVLPSIYEVLKF